MKKIQENLASPLDKPIYKAVWYKVSDSESAELLNSKEVLSKTPAFRGNKNDVDSFHFKDGSTLFGSNTYVEIVENKNPQVLGVVKFNTQ